MVKGTCIDEIIKDFSKDVKDKIPSSEIYLFGSYAKGNAKQRKRCRFGGVSDFLKEWIKLMLM